MRDIDALQERIRTLEAEVTRLRPVYHAAKKIKDLPFSFVAMDGFLHNLRTAIDEANDSLTKPNNEATK